jgi:hypothetical protein
MLDMLKFNIPKINKRDTSFYVTLVSPFVKNPLQLHPDFDLFAGFFSESLPLTQYHFFFKTINKKSPNGREAHGF